MSFVTHGRGIYHSDTCWTVCKRKGATTEPVANPKRDGLRPCGTCLPNEEWHRPVVYFAKTNPRWGRYPEGLIKIGCSIDLTRRMSELPADVGSDIADLMATMPGDFATEAAVHRTFADERLSPGSELFHPSPRLLAYIEGIGS